LAREVKLALGVAIAVAASVLLWAGGASSKPPSGGGRLAKAQKLDGKVTKGLNNLLRATRTQLVQLSQIPSVRAQDATGCNSDMAAAAAEAPPYRYTGIGAANLSGDLYCLSPPPTSAINIADRAYFLRAVGTKSFGVGDFQIGRSSGISAIGTGYPVRDAGGAVNGIVLAALSLPFLHTYLTNQRPHAAFDVLVVDDHGTVLGRAGRRQTPSGVNLGSSRLVDSMVKSDHGSGLFQIAGSAVITAWDTVPLSDGATHVAVSVKP
jgi:hypothetical protein